MAQDACDGDAATASGGGGCAAGAAWSLNLDASPSAGGGSHRPPLPAIPHTRTEMLKPEQREQVERRLLEERESALEAIRDFDEQRQESLEDAQSEMSSYRFHPADIGTEAMEREKQFLMASKEGERLYRANDALRLLYSDEEKFSRCSNCGSEISMERLMVVPTTRLCAQCARAAEE